LQKGLSLGDTLNLKCVPENLVDILQFCDHR
jgi:hypothetical protein